MEASTTTPDGGVNLDAYMEKIKAELKQEFDKERQEWLTKQQEWDKIKKEQEVSEIMKYDSYKSIGYISISRCVTAP